MAIVSQGAPQAPSPSVRPGVPSPAGPTPPAAPQVAGAQNIGELAAQLAQLTVQERGLSEQRSSLRSQLESMRLDNPGRAGVQQAEANVSMQLAQVRGDLAQVRAQIAAQRGELVSTAIPAIPPIPGSRSFDPDLAAGLMFAFIFAVCMPIAIAYARRIWRGKPQPVAPRTDDLAPRLDRLEQAVDAIAIEIERVSEGQRFVTKILADRGSAASGAHGSPSAAEALQEGAPIRALGAGPIEPIRVAEGQKVRQSGGQR
jgi:hypothetical protein